MQHKVDVNGEITKTSDARITALEQEIAKMNLAVQPLSAAFQAVLIKQLTHIHTPELDALLVKLGPPVTLTAEEEVRLSTLLKERTTDMHDEIDDSEREAAEMLPLVIKRVKAEQGMNKDDVVNTLVGVPAQKQKDANEEEEKG